MFCGGNDEEELVAARSRQVLLPADTSTSFRKKHYMESAAKKDQCPKPIGFC